EAVSEDLTVKQQVLKEVEGATRDTAVFASNTSTIPIARIAEAANRPERVIGMHFFSPVARMPLLEVIPSERTAPGVIGTAVAFGARVTPSPAFAGMGKAGRLGRKAGKGFYTYVRGKKGGVDQAVYELIGVQPNGGPRPAEIIQRLVLVMLNEAARAVGEGVVRTPRDGDIGAIFGFGFPPFRGGPLRHADDLGAARIAGELERLAERYGARFAPCEVLQEQARANRKFYP